MLQGIFGNKNVERILLFLFVNDRGYGTQMQTLLQVPLTPLQKALLRLEREGIIQSNYEGKTGIYQFNPAYPLRMELETLLKKAYTLLPAQEKKRYCYIHRPRMAMSEESKRERNKRSELLAFWQKLEKTKKLSFSAQSRHGEEQSTKVGQADVMVTSPTPSVLVFQEKGHWVLDQIPDTAFSNSFRWTLDLNTLLMTLEHLRYGTTHPVFLFHFTPSRPFTLESVDAHLCAEDTYLGNIVWNSARIDFQWRIIGPHKNSHLVYHYF